MALTTAERQRAYRQRQKQKGLVTFTALVHEQQIPELQSAIDLLKADPHLVVALLRSNQTGRYKKV